MNDHGQRSLSLPLLIVALCLVAGALGPARADDASPIHGSTVETATVDGATVDATLGDPAVTEGREALGRRFGGYNWYDESQDAERQIALRVPWDWSWEWSGPNLNLPIGQIVKILAWIVLLAVVGWLAYLLIRAYLDRERMAASAAPSSDSALLAAARIEALPEEVRRDASDLLGAAQRHYELGNYREAMIFLFSHELVELDRGQRIRLARGKTNRQYLRETSALPTLAELFEQAIVTFEAVFFGNHPLDRAAFETCWTQLPELERLARGESA